MKGRKTKLSRPRARYLDRGSRDGERSVRVACKISIVLNAKDVNDGLGPVMNSDTFCLAVHF